MKQKKRSITWKNFHRWAGLIVAVFILVFSVSGIILNHRAAVRSCNVSRSLLPASYRIKDYNNGVVRGTVSIGQDSLLAFGTCGVWLTDPGFNNTSDFNKGLPKGADNRSIRNIVKTADGNIWCASQFGLYELKNGIWQEITLSENDERLSDVTLSNDNEGIVVVTRSSVYTLSDKTEPRKLELKVPENESNKVTLFKTIWHLHSGELFGTVGKIIVDLAAVILIFLSLTGIALFILPYSIKAKIRKGIRSSSTTKIFRWNFRWHNSIGVYTFVFTLLIAVTGACLRPPLMIPFVLTKTNPLPRSSLDKDNFWHDKLRAIRWDTTSARWLLSTSEGFYSLASLDDTPVAFPKEKSPQVSPMGINVFHEERPGQWIIGSFSGIYRWNLFDGTCHDYFTGEKIDSNRRSYGLADNLTCGYSADTFKPVVFDYSKGTQELPNMDEDLRNHPISLWNVALELHVGRCYSPFLGPVSDLFVFLAGVIISLVLISGYIIHKAHNKEQ